MELFYNSILEQFIEYYRDVASKLGFNLSNNPNLAEG